MFATKSGHGTGGILFESHITRLHDGVQHELPPVDMSSRQERTATQERTVTVTEQIVVAVRSWASSQ
eukprot:471185-Pyramimonas_sp.AAC.1